MKVRSSKFRKLKSGMHLAKYIIYPTVQADNSPPSIRILRALF
jgi:hypothetical protein